jgi:hypothetical protein
MAIDNGPRKYKPQEINIRTTLLQGLGAPGLEILWFTLVV